MAISKRSRLIWTTAEGTFHNDHVTRTPSTDRLPPYSPEAEKSVLGCVLIDSNAVLPLCIEKLRAGGDEFYDLRHQEMYKVFLELYEDRDPIDIVTVNERARLWQKLDMIGGITYVCEVQNYPPSSANAEHYLKIVCEKFLLRRLVHTCTDLVGRVYECEGEAGDLMDQAEREILAIRPRQRSTTPTIVELVRCAINRIEETWQRQGALEGIGTGFIDLDKMTGGLRNGEMTVVAGYPGAGKTSFAMNLSEHAMLQLGKKVGVFSLEMSAESLVTRFICSHARVNLRNVAEGFLTDRDFPRLTGAAGRISNAEIWFEDESDLSIYQLRAKARRMHQEHAIELLVVDYLQLLTAIGGSRKVENRQQEVSDISRGIKGMARELNIPVIALSQLNDEGKLRESRAIGQDADNVWRLKPHHEEEDEEENIHDEAEPVDLEIIKARNGPRGKIHLTFLKNYTRFESAARVSDEDVPAGHQSQRQFPDP